MTTEELIDDIVSTVGDAPSNAKWKIFMQHEVQLSRVNGGIRVSWRDDLGDQRMDIVPGQVDESTIDITSNAFRRLYRFTHRSEGGVKLTCQTAYKE